jgi:transcriptional regulator with XRE-family HTH domain
MGYRYNTRKTIKKVKSIRGAVDLPIVAMIEDVIDSRETKTTWTELANAAGITKAALSNFKNRNSEPKFPVLLSIAKYLFKKDHVKVIKEWCLSLSLPGNVKYALEFLAINRQVDDLEKLIEKIRTEKPNKDLMEWADGYALLAQYLRGNDYVAVLNQIRFFVPKTAEMKILSLVTEIWCRHKLMDYITMSTLVNELELSIEEIKDEFIRESYRARYKEALAYVNLYKLDNKELARKYAEEIIFANVSPTLTANAAYLVGMSYLFDNYDKCLGNVLRYRELLEESGREREIEIVDNNDVPFINNLWKKHTEQPQTNDISEKAHYEALMGNKELAVELIDKAIEKGGQSGFKLYYKALATGDMSLFMQSLIIFVSKKGDKFYANLPYEHLKCDPVYKQMADLLLND